MKTRKIMLSERLLAQLLAARNALTRSRAHQKPETDALDELIAIVAGGIERPTFERVRRALPVIDAPAKAAEMFSAPDEGPRAE